MSRKRRALFNATSSVVQVVVTGGLYVLLYRFLYDTIGIERFGVWSVVIAWTSANNLANLGLGGSTIYFLPKYLARGDRAYARELVQTATLSAAAAVAAGLVVFYPGVRAILPLFIAPAPLLAEGLTILPYAFAALWLSSTGSIVYSCLDGLQRVDLRNGVLMAATATFLVSAWLLVPTRGLVGLAQAQVLQGGLLLAGSWLLVRCQMPALPLVPLRWSRRAFREMLGFSFRLQLITIARLLLEPLAKSLAARFGGAAAAGFFEMANKMVLQLRALIISAYVAVVPTLTDLHEAAPERVRAIYALATRLVQYLVYGSLPLLVGLAPLLSVLWLGELEPTFVLFAVLLLAGWFGNVLGAPAYFSYLSAGELRWNLRSHVLTAVLNVAVGVPLGLWLGGAGVVAGFVAAVLGGIVLVVGAYHAQHGLGYGMWAEAESLRLGAAAVVGMAGVVALYAAFASRVAPLPLLVGSLGLYGLIVALPLWHHSMRREIGSWLAHLPLARAQEPTDV